MNFVSKDIESYCLEHSQDVSDVLIQLERETHLKTLAPQMLSGRLQGQFLTFICRMLRPKRILEIGTFTGYSAICMAIGCEKEVQIDTLEANFELEAIVRKFIDLSGYHDQIHLHLGNAQSTIPRLDGPYDLVFIDANKQDYAQYLELMMPLLKTGSYVIADNVLWSGKVMNPEEDADAIALHHFNKACKADPRIENLMLPIRDGVNIMRIIQTDI